MRSTHIITHHHQHDTTYHKVGQVATLALHAERVAKAN